MFRSPPQPARQTAQQPSRGSKAAPTEPGSRRQRQTGRRASSRQSSQPASSKQDSRCLQASIRHLPPTFATEAPASRPATQRASTQPDSQTAGRHGSQPARSGSQIAQHAHGSSHSRLWPAPPKIPRKPTGPPILCATLCAGYARPTFRDALGGRCFFMKIGS